MSALQRDFLDHFCTSIFCHTHPSWVCCLSPPLEGQLQEGRGPPCFVPSAWSTVGAQTLGLRCCGYTSPCVRAREQLVRHLPSCPALPGSLPAHCLLALASLVYEVPWAHQPLHSGLSTTWLGQCPSSRFLIVLGGTHCANR